MSDGVVESLGRLSAQRAAAGVSDGSRDHHRKGRTSLVIEAKDREDGGLGVQRVEDRLDHQDVGPSIHEPTRLIGVCLHQLVEVDITERRVVHVR